MPDNAEIVLVTGCSSGIGRACCDVLSQNRVVYGASRTKTASDRWRYLEMDVTDDLSVERAIAAIMSCHRRIDAVVHCAGSSLAGSVEETTTEEAINQFNINYFGAVRVLRAVLPGMRQQKSGKLVVIGSIGGLIGLPFQSHYSATKFALDGMAEAACHELSPLGIHVSLVHPGNFKTALHVHRRLARGSLPDSPYRSASERTIRFYTEEELNARSPQIVALTVKKILSKKRPRLRYLVGTQMEILGVAGKRILPSTIFNMLLRLLYFP